ncbi:MAG: T9SS type A sorting domain-containing protein [Bacteroidales bacterium]
MELSDVSINVYSLSGTLVYHQDNIEGPQYQFALNAEAGTYILEIIANLFASREKLIIR